MLTKALANHLHIVQFPIKNNSYSLDKKNILNCGLKPESQQMKIDFALDTSSQHYDAFKGEMMGPKDEPEQHQRRFGSRLEKITLNSSLVNDPRYAVGVMIDKNLHLMPVKSIYQMRQNFVHLSKAEKRSTQNQKQDQDSDEEMEDLKQVTVKFAKTGDAEKIKKAKERSYHFISQIGADEPWCESLIHPKTSNQSEMERHKITEMNCNDDESFTGLSSNDYFPQLLSDKLSFEAVELKREENSKNLDSIGPLSKQQIRKLPLLDQIKVILKDGESLHFAYLNYHFIIKFFSLLFIAKILSYDALKKMLTDSQLTDEKILRNLLLCGLMVRGNWTLQSDILFPDNYVSFKGGVPGELMSRGRDYVINKLLKNEMKTFSKKRLCAVTQLPVNEVQEILESIACLNTDGKTKYWEFTKSPDYDFEKRHQDIVQRQDSIWKSQEEKFAEMESEKQEKRPRKKSIRDSKHF